MLPAAAFGIPTLVARKNLILASVASVVGRRGFLRVAVDGRAALEEYSERMTPLRSWCSRTQ